MIDEDDDGVIVCCCSKVVIVICNSIYVRNKRGSPRHAMPVHFARATITESCASDGRSGEPTTHCPHGGTVAVAAVASAPSRIATKDRRLRQ